MFYPVDPYSQPQRIPFIKRNLKKILIFLLILIIYIIFHFAFSNPVSNSNNSSDSELPKPIPNPLPDPSSSQTPNYSDNEQPKPIPKPIPDPSPSQTPIPDPIPSPIPTPDPGPSSNPNILKRYLLNKSSDAKCLDGTPYAVYYAPGYGDGKNKVVINFWGMNWCYGRTRAEILKSCSSRFYDYYGSSNYFKEEYTYGYDFLGGEESKNKYFFNWHRVDFPYCDGTAGQGYVTDFFNYNDKKIFFR